MKNLLVVLIIFLFIKSYGQIELDTIKFKNVKIKTVDSIESLEMKIIDTLSKPKSYLLTKNEKPESIAIKKGCNYLVFDLLPNSEYGYVTHTERIQINGKCYKELVVYWTNVNGRSGMRGGFREEFKGIIIYDLKKVKNIFDREYFFSSHNWTYEEDEDEDEDGITSNSEYIECDNFDIKFADKEIIMELKTSKDCDSINFLDYEITKWNYKLKKNSFIGKGIKTTSN